jgi:hypothetical protein
MPGADLDAFSRSKFFTRITIPTKTAFSRRCDVGQILREFIVMFSDKLTNEADK